MAFLKTIILLNSLIIFISKINNSDIIKNNYKAIACLSLSRNALNFEKVKKIIN